MFTKILTIVIVALFMTVNISAQYSEFKEQKKVTINHQDETSIQTVLETVPTIFSVSNENHQTIAMTTYDYFANSVIRSQVAYYDGKVVFIPMLRGHADPPSLRQVMFIYNDGTNWVQLSPFGTGASGWGDIDVALTGDYTGTFALVAHTPCRLAIYDGDGGFFVSEFNPNTDPSLTFSGQDIYLGSSGNRIQYLFYKTEDFGNTFFLWDSISSFPNIYWTGNGGVEIDIFKSNDEDDIVYLGTSVGDGHVFNGIDPSKADNVWIVYSTDRGVNWSGKMIAADGDINTLPDYAPSIYVDSVGGTVYNNFVSFKHAPLFENFGQVSGTASNDGVIHVVANGYGAAFATVNGEELSTSLYPVLYYNSAIDKWKVISDIAIDTLDLADGRPGNAIGQSYPSVAVSEDGKYVYAIWSGPRIGPDGDALFDPDGRGKFYTDLYHAYSQDFGQTWTYGGVFVTSDDTTSFIYPTLYKHLQYDADTDSFIAHIFYLNDLQTGTSVFAGTNGVATVNPLVYATFSISSTPVGNIDNDLVSLYSFELNQNYPNPFNPATTIKYTLAQENLVTLKVYNILGKEVATLVNDVKKAGTHEVSFDASKLSSGMYIYTINAGDFIASKKMILLR